MFTPENVQFIENDTEISFSYNIGGVRRNISILVSDGKEPACMEISDWSDVDAEPINKISLPANELDLIIKLLKYPRASTIFEN